MVFASDRSAAPNRVALPFGAAAMLTLLVLMGAIGLVAAGFHPPLALEATLAGVIWAVLFLAGFAVGSFARGRFAGAALVSAVFWLANSAFVQLSDFSLSECRLLGCVLIACGWLAAYVGQRHWTWLVSQRYASPESSAEPRIRFSIWDMAVLTSLVAIGCSCWNQLETPAAFAACVFFSMAGGIICSWIAGRWALHDHWSIASLLSILILTVGVLLVTLFRWPVPVHISFSWLVSGPINAIAAQSATVLLVCGVLRWENKRVSQDSASGFE